MLDGFQYPPVMVLAALWAALGQKDSHALFAQQSNDGINEGKNQGVCRSFRECKVKIEIRLDERVRILARFIHHGDRLAHGRQGLLVGARCREGGNLGLQNLANFGQVTRPFGLPDADHAIQRLPDGLRSPIRDEGPAPGKSFHMPFFAESFDGLADGRATDAKLQRQFAFRRKLIARLHRALAD